MQCIVVKSDEFVAPYIFPSNPDYVAARSLRSLRSNYSFINLNTSRQVKLSDNNSKHYLCRVTLACFAKTLERRSTLLCFTICQLFCFLLEIHDYYNLLHFNNYTLFQGFLQTTLTLDNIFNSARQQSMTTKIYFKNVLCLLSFQIHNVFTKNR